MLGSLTYEYNVVLPFKWDEDSGVFYFVVPSHCNIISSSHFLFICIQQVLLMSCN